MLDLQDSINGLMALLLFCLVPMSSAVPSALKLIALVPASGQVVSGLNAVPHEQSTASFRLTHNDAVDLQGPLAVFGAGLNVRAGGFREFTVEHSQVLLSPRPLDMNQPGLNRSGRERTVVDVDK